MMQPAENRRGDHSLIIRDLMTVRLRQSVDRHGRNARTEAGVRSGLVVVTHPLLEHAPKMPFIQHNQPVETLSTDRADQPLAIGIRLRAAHRSLQHRQTHCGNCPVDGRRINAVAVVNEEALWLIAGNHRAELLDGPVGRGVLRHVPMHDPACADLQEDEDSTVCESSP